MRASAVKGSMRKFFAGVLIGLSCVGGGTVCWAQTTSAALSDLSPDVQEVLTLSRQHMDDSVITNYIMSTGKSYKLSAEDIIYLNNQGVSQAVISTLLETGSNPNANNQTPSPVQVPTQPPASSQTAPPAESATPAPLAMPPALDANPAPPAPTPNPVSVAMPSTPAPAVNPGINPGGPMMPPPLQDTFYVDGGLNPYIWQTESGLLASLAAANGNKQKFPNTVFSPSGMELKGIGHGDFMGIQSAMAYSATFSFSTTVSGLSQNGIPFQLYLISADMQQWLSVAGHLGGRPHRPADVRIGLFGPYGGASFGVPTGDGYSPDYGVWINHTGSGLPISALGDRFFPAPVANVPYTIQVSVGNNGLASVTLLESGGGILAGQSVPVGTGPFYVVLAGRDGGSHAMWQSVQLTPTMPTPAPAAVQQAVSVPPTPTLDYFQQQLAPYGTWVTLPGYGVCWQPAVSPGWRPYYDGGHWEYTDAGWFWQSDYSWGDIAFHYGRWAYTASGWVWVPGYDYAPSWVVWRHDDAGGYVGWAPLPPGAVYVNNGWYYNGRSVAVDFDFGLGPNYFTFVAYDHFWVHDFRPYVVPHDRVVVIYGHSTFDNHYHYDHGHFVDEGIPHDHVVEVTHHDVHPVPMNDLRHDEEMHHAEERQNDIHDYHPGTSHPDAMKGHPPGPGGNPHSGQNGNDHQGH